jgi:hypothetical protein
VLCLHGFPDRARSFRFQLLALLKAASSAALYEGVPSDARQWPYQAAALAKDAVALIGRSRRRSPPVFGHDQRRDLRRGADRRSAPVRSRRRRSYGLQSYGDRYELS